MDGHSNLDTLKLSRKLEAGGFTREQAATAAEALAESLREVSDLATKGDLRELELRLTLKLGTMLAAAVAIVAALTKLIG